MSEEFWAINCMQTPKLNVPRTQLVASNRHGIQLLDVVNVIYFRAEHKYISANYHGGSILLNDTLNALEQEFGSQFLRIHRNTLVATKQIRACCKDETGNWFVALLDCEDKFPVSRRQLPKVRKYLKHRA